MSKPKILHIGGSHSAHVVDLVKRLDQEGYSQAVLSYRNENLLPKHIHVYKYPYGIFYPDKKLEKQERSLCRLLQAIMRLEKPDIIHAHFLIMACVPLYLLAEMYGIPIVLSPWSLRALDNNATLRSRLSRGLGLSNYFLTDKYVMFSEFKKVYPNMTEDMFVPFRLPLNLSRYHNAKSKDLSHPKILSARVMQANYHQDLLVNSLPALIKEFPNTQVTLIIGQSATQGKPYFTKMQELAKKLNVHRNCRFIDRGLSQDEFSELIEDHNIVYSVADDPGCSQTTIQAAYSGAITIVKENFMENGILDHNVNVLRTKLSIKDVTKQLLYAARHLKEIQPRFFENNRKLKTQSTEYTFSTLTSLYDKIMEKFEKCVCCDSNVEIIKHNKYTLAKCANCGVYYHYPLPTEKFLAKYYSSEDMSKRWKGNLQRAINRNHHQNVGNYKYYFDFIEQERKEQPTGKVLDIGCYTGEFLKQFANAGYHCTGIDLNAGLTKYGKKKFRLNLQKGAVKDFNFPNDSFEFVTFHQVLEHLVNPMDFFTEIRRIVKTGGFISLSIPDVENNFKMTYPEHVFHYSEKTIKMLFDKFGFVGRIHRRLEQKAIIAVGKKI